VVVDASFLLKLFLPEEGSDQADTLWQGWIDDLSEVCAPTLVVFEVASVLRNKVSRGILDSSVAIEILHVFRSLDLKLVYTDRLLDLAWDVGTTLKVPALYDCFYVALAQLLGCPLWTADGRLYRAVRRRYHFVHLLPGRGSRV
jgi:predicted nucleic acid-binding protein